MMRPFPFEIGDEVLIRLWHAEGDYHVVATWTGSSFLIEGDALTESEIVSYCRIAELYDERG